MARNSEVIVIGGGVVGLCVAHYLQRAGHRVMVIEKNEIGSGCSAGNAGLIVPSHIIPLAAPGIIHKGLQWLLDPASPFYLRPRFDPALFAWLWRFWRAARESQMHKSLPVLHELLQQSCRLFQDLAEENPNRFFFQQKGLMMLCATEKAFATEQADAKLAREIGMSVQVLENGALTTLLDGIATPAVGGVYYEKDAHLEPVELTRTLHENLLRDGVVFETATEVLHLAKRGRRLTQILTNRGTFAADTFVLASGAWSAALVQTIGLRMLLQGGKGYSITVPAAQGQPPIPIILAEAKVALTPLGNRFRIAGTLELSGLDLSHSQRRLAAMLEAIPRYFPYMPPAPADKMQVWAGLRPCSPDGLPYIGRFRECPNLIAATGHAMLGVTLAPITGKLVAGIVAEEASTFDLAPLSPDRFSHS